MKASQYANLPTEEKRKLIKAAARGANKDQRDLMQRYRESVKMNGNSR